MKECDNSKIHISSKPLAVFIYLFCLFVCL